MGSQYPPSQGGVSYIENLGGRRKKRRVAGWLIVDLGMEAGGGRFW